MGLKSLLSLLAVVFVLSSAGVSRAGEPEMRKAPIGMKSGRAGERPVNKPEGKTRSTDRGKNNKFTDRHADNKHGGHRKKHHGKNPNKIYPFFPTYGYYPYPNSYDYSYADPDYPLGYGTTLGTTLERQSNIEANQSLNKDRAPGNPPQPYPSTGGNYTEGLYYGTYEYHSPPPSEERVIYVWTDAGGVDNYVNDPGLIPPGQRDNARILGGE